MRGVSIGCIEPAIDRIRNAIARGQSYFMTMQELAELCPGEDDATRFKAFASLARQEQAAFAFCPDGTVQISRLDPLARH
jgi:hypothetical protein